MTQVSHLEDGDRSGYQAKLARDKDEHQSFQDKRGTFIEFKKTGGKCFKKKRDGLI